MANTLPMAVIRRPRSRRGAFESLRRDDDLRPGANVASALKMVGSTVARADLTAREVSDLREDDAVEAVIPILPFTLPPAVEADGAAPAPPAGVSWGIEASGVVDVPADAGAGVVVAVLDTGINLGHPAFAHLKDRIVTNDLTPVETGEDDVGHGSHVAGIIFGGDVDGVRIGIARGVAKVLNGKVLCHKDRGDTCDTQRILQAIWWALGSGAHVVNMSLGLDFPGYQQWLVEQKDYHPRKATSIALAGYRANVRAFDDLSRGLAIDERMLRGAVLVAPTGNESERPTYTITVAPPAAGERILSVAAVDRTMAVATFSNDEAKIAGPGVDIWSASHLDHGLRLDSGTSMAAPHVSGVAALHVADLLARREFSAPRVAERLIVDAKPIGSRRDVGAGLVRWNKPPA